MNQPNEATAGLPDDSIGVEADTRLVTRNGTTYAMNTANIGKGRRSRGGGDPEGLAKRFAHHSPSDDQATRQGAIRSAALALAAQVVALCPDSRERATALTHIDAATMFANAAIARNE